ncbi:MAG TPA: RidA family protein [Gaiellaceae bacterium]|nr:RidA family protein [Gaiellaceae bacterium]
MDREVSDGHRIVTAPGLAEPVGYAHAVVAAPGRTVYLGGQVALDAGGNVRGETIAEQFDLAAANVVAALAAAGGRPDELVSLLVFVTDMREYRASLGELGVVWRRHFGSRYPAMALVAVSDLVEPDARVELVGVAVLRDG